MPAKIEKIPGDKQAERLIRLYATAEKEISQRLQRVIAKRGTGTYTASQLKRQLAEVKAIIEELRKTSPELINKFVKAAYGGGAKVAEAELKRAGIPIIAKMGAINNKVMATYAGTISSRMSEVLTTTGRRTEDIYAILRRDDALAGVLSGYDTITQAEKKLLENAADGKITGFVDAAGRNWDIKSYVSMLARTATMEMYNDAKKNEYLAHNEDLVIVSSHGGSCKLCSPFDGKVLSLTGATRTLTGKGGYVDIIPTLDEAKAEGFMHPNCKHTYSLYIDDDPDVGRLDAEEEEKKPKDNTDEGSPFDEIGIKGTEKWNYITGDHSIDECLATTNPNYKKGSFEWARNCQRCVPTYEMRRRGYDVVAMPRLKVDQMPQKSTWSKVFENSNLENLGAKTKAKQMPLIEQKLQQWGNGARAEVRVTWKNGKGHVFVAENDNGVVRYIDPQNGSKNCSQYFDYTKPQSTEIMRIDNLKPTDLILQCCQPRTVK